MYLWCSAERGRHPEPGELSLYHLPFLLQEECQNYVRVLIVTGRKVFLCGTNAFSPMCSSRQVGTTRGAGGGSQKGTWKVLPPRHIALE